MKTKTLLTLEKFLTLSSDNTAFELIEGQAVPKMSPKYFHSRLQKTLLLFLEKWSQGKGRIETEWAVLLQRNEQDWVPVPDLVYVSFERLSMDWLEDEACPVLPELVIEIISPGQTFGEMTAKATDYLKAGVNRVWVVDSQSQTITIFYPDKMPQTLSGETVIIDSLLPQLELKVQTIFQSAGIIS